MEEALLTPPPSDIESAFHVRLPVISEAQTQDSSCETCGQRVEKEDERFEAFNNKKIVSTFHEAFAVGRRFRIHKRKLPPPPKTIRDPKSHSYREKFLKTQRDHLDSHHQMQSFHEMNRKHARSQRILHCKIFIYKTDKHGFLQKCKARLVICENQQAQRDLLTRATTLASMAFPALMMITAKFDLEMT